MSKDGLPVKKPKGKSVVMVEKSPDQSQVDVLSIPELKEQFDLARVEKELDELEKEEGFFGRLSRSLSEERMLKRFKNKKEVVELKKQIRQGLFDMEKQRVLIKGEILEVRTALLEKIFMSTEQVQKVIMDIKLKDLKIQKLKKDLELLGLERTKKELEKELVGRGAIDSDQKYSLKNLHALGTSPEGEDDDGEDAT